MVKLRFAANVFEVHGFIADLARNFDWQGQIALEGFDGLHGFDTILLLDNNPDAYTPWASIEIAPCSLSESDVTFKAGSDLASDDPWTEAALVGERLESLPIVERFFGQVVAEWSKLHEPAAKANPQASAPDNLSSGPACPTTQRRLAQWQATWKALREARGSDLGAMSYNEMSHELAKRGMNQYHRHTLKKIIEAGSAGLLG